MKYNLIRNGVFSSLTGAGEGNVDLSWQQLEYLMNEETQDDPGANSVTVSGSDVLYLQADLSSRIKVDGIRLYLTSSTASGTILSDNLDFYYKNETADSYSLCSKSLGDGYYSATIASPSAPRYVLCVVSGTAEKIIYEFEIFNDDYIVAFGEDGQTFSEYLDDTPIGEIGEAQAVALYNNTTGIISADAYTCADWTGSDGDRYVEISTSRNGNYYSIDDGVVMGSDFEDEEYRWSHGSHSNTTVSNDKVVVSTSYNVTNLGVIPLTTTTNNWNVAENAMAYDSVNNVMYVMGSDGILKLWKYDIDANTYTYRGEVWPGGSTTHQYYAAMVYLNGYVYAMKNYAGGWGRHDVNGALSNWTTLASHPNGSLQTAPGRRALCTDGVRYIYCIDHAGDSNATTKRFARFDTVSLTWSSLNTGYFATTEFYRMYNWLVYGTDGVNDYIYYLGGLSYQSTSNWVQRYDVANDSWITTFLQTETFPNYTATIENKAMAYWNKQLWFKFSSGSPPHYYLYRYDISTDTLTSFYTNFGIDYTGQWYYSVYCLAVEPDAGDLAKIYFGNVYNDKGDLYVWKLKDSGTYTTPVIKIDNQYDASYFVIDGTAVSGTGSISYDPDVFNGTIRVRSSNTEPVPLVEAQYMYFSGDRYAYALRYTPYTGSTSGSQLLLDLGGDTYRRHMHQIAGTASSPIKDRMAFSFSDRAWDSSNYSSYLYITSRLGTVLYSKQSDYGDYETAYTLFFNVNMEFDKWGGIWGYGSSSKYLYHFNYNLGTTLASVYDGSDFLSDLSVDYEGDGVWYTNKNTNQIIHLNSGGTTTLTINQRQPRAICANQDGSIWVYDTSDSKIRKFSSAGLVLLEVSIDESPTRIRSDLDNGFWAYDSTVDDVYHFNSSGVKDVDVHFDRIDGIAPSLEGCTVFDTAANYYYFIDMDGVQYRSRSVEGEVTLCSTYNLNYEKDREYGLSLVPISADPVWKSGGTAEWQEVAKDGYFLPKVRYHQAAITLRGDAELEKVIIAPVIKKQDIAPGTSQDIYVRTNIPEDAEVVEQETKLRTWWGEVE